MDRALEKVIEKARKLRAKENYQKARALLEEQPYKSRDELAYSHEWVGLSLRMDFWQDVIKQLRELLPKHRLGALLGGENQDLFVTMARENAAFSHALLELMDERRDLENVADWFVLLDDEERSRTVRAWLEESEKQTDAEKAAAVRACVGVGLYTSKDEVGALHHWGAALQGNPKLFKRIMSFCQQPGRMGENQLDQRLKLIRLVAYAGRLTETLSLLQALGTENREAAQKVLSSIPLILEGRERTKEVIAVRFSLALKIADRPVIEAVVRDMDELNDDDLFTFKKMVLHQLDNPKLRLAVLISFVNLYIRQENWENAAPLLQTIYDDNPNEQVVGLMEQVLDRFPIISSLRYILGKHYLGVNLTEKAIGHLATIAQVPEFETAIRMLLEEQLVKGYDTSVAELLVRVRNIYSHRAGLVALQMALKDPRGFLACLDGWGNPHMREQTSPFWALALIHGFLGIKRYDKGLIFLQQFIRNFPEVSPEAIRICERFCKEYATDYTELVRILDEVAGRLEPKRAWVALRKHLVSTSQKARLKEQQAAELDQTVQLPPKESHKKPVGPSKEQPAPQAAAPVRPKPAAASPPRPTAPAAPVSPVAGVEKADLPPGNLPPEFQQFRKQLSEGNLGGAAEMAEKTVANHPQTILFILNQLERLSKEQPRELLWARTMLRILITSTAFDKAVEVGRRVIASHPFQADMPQIYHLLARAYEGLGDSEEALRFYCLCSRQARFYEQNGDRLVEMVLPTHPQFVEEVVQLILNNEDQERWETLLKVWYKNRPMDLEKIIDAQERFTETLGSPRAILDLAFWYLQAGRLDDIDATLNRIDLDDPEIMDYLTHLAHLAHMKYPEDPKPKFLLGKYYLVQKDITKAVDTFRNLARQTPDAAESIYHFLRNHLKKNPAGTDLVTLYGLLIRFALDYGSSVAAVRLLAELGQQDREGAASLVNGVYRVILGKKERMEALYELMGLLANWQEHTRLLDVAEQGGLGDHMAAERLEWLGKVAEDANLRDRAMLAIAHVYYDTFEFSRCREALRRIEDGSIRRRALSLYERLSERFPEQTDIWREAGWAAYPQDVEKASVFFHKLLSCDHFENRLEAFAVLASIGERPDLEPILAMVEDENQAYERLHQLYQQVRESELNYYLSSKEALPLASLRWLIESGRIDHCREHIQDHPELSAETRRQLEAECLQIQGHFAQAAQHLLGGKLPEAVVQSYCFAAGMLESAVLAKRPGTRLPMFLREAFQATHGKPQMLTPSAKIVRNMAYHHQHRPQVVAAKQDPKTEVES